MDDFVALGAPSVPLAVPAAFDEDLRARDPRWGVRDLEAVLALAEASGLDHVETVRMPANNLLVALRKR